MKNPLTLMWQRFWNSLKEKDQVEIAFMGQVDAALHRKPRIGPLILSTGTVVMLCVLLLWAAWAEVDEVTHGQGQVVSSQRTQSIENLEGGILEAILVREGQPVEKGSPLAQINNEASASQYRDALGKSYEQRVAIIRLTATLSGVEPVFPPDLENNAAQIIADQMALHESRKEQFLAELNALNSQYKQKMRDVEEQTNRKRQLEESLVLINEQLALTQSLVNRQLYSRIEFLNQKQKAVSLKGDLEALATSIPKAEAAAQEAEQKSAFRRAEIRSAVAEEINKRRAELTSLQESLTAGSDRVTRTELRSTVRGVVKRIMLNTVGGVVKPGEPIMEIVPMDDTLLVEVQIRPADIAFIRPAQKAVVKISAYDFSIYGGLEAQVEQISADTIEDRKGEFHYLVKVRTFKNAIHYRGQDLPIIPGMMCTTDILTGKKTILDFLLKPILKSKENALRER